MTSHCVIIMDVPGGTGPWFCCLLFNTAKKSKKKTHLIAHTLPHLALDVLNHDDRAAAPPLPESCCWIMILKVGPFQHWAASVRFLDLWSPTRGKKKRLERGLELYMSYRTTYSLQLWTQKEDAPLIAVGSKRAAEEDDDDDDDDDDHQEGDDVDKTNPVVVSPHTAMVAEVEALRAMFSDNNCTVGSIKEVLEKFKCKAPKKSKRKK